MRWTIICVVRVYLYCVHCFNVLIQLLAVKFNKPRYYYYYYYIIIIIINRHSPTTQKKYFKIIKQNEENGKCRRQTA